MAESKWLFADEQRLAEMLDAGMTAHQIAAEMERKPKAVTAKISSYKQGALTVDQCRMIRTMWQAGMTDAAISEAVGGSPKGVLSYRNRNGWTNGKIGRPKGDKGGPDSASLWETNAREGSAKLLTALKNMGRAPIPQESKAVRRINPGGRIVSCPIQQSSMA